MKYTIVNLGKIIKQSIEIFRISEDLALGLKWREENVYDIENPNSYSSEFELINLKGEKLPIENLKKENKKNYRIRNILFLFS